MTRKTLVEGDAIVVGDNSEIHLVLRLVTIVYGNNFVSVIVPYIIIKYWRDKSKKLFYELKYQKRGCMNTWRVLLMERCENGLELLLGVN